MLLGWRSKIAIIILILSSTLLQAQDYVDLAQAFYSNTPLSQFEDSENKTNVQDFGLSLTYPQKLKNGNAIILGADAETMSAKFTASGDMARVGSVMAKIGYNQALGTKWSGTYIFLPKVASDFYGPADSKDFQYGALVIFKYIKRSDFKYKLGLYYNSELFGPFFVPVLGVYYKSPNKKFETDLALPINGDANYRITPKVLVGVRFVALVRSYNIHKTYYSAQGEYLTKASNDLFAYVGYEFKGGLILRGQAGYTFGRRFRLYESDDKVDWGLSAAKFGDERIQLNTDFNDGLIFRVDLTYRFYTK